MLSHCASKYALAISDPWHPDAQGACIPRFPARPSQKVTSFLRGNAVIGTGGTAIILVSPTLANDATMVWTSSGVFAGNANAAITAATPGIVSYPMPNLPYLASQLSVGSSNVSPVVAGRIVSCSLKASYIGTVLNSSGLYYGICTPDHENVNGISIGSFSETEVKPVRPGSSIEIVCSGQSDAEVSYSGNASLAAAEETLSTLWPFSNGNQFSATDTSGAAIMKIAVTGVPNENIYWEIVLHAEYVGTVTSGKLTPSHTDSRGFEMVQQAAANLATKKVASPGSSLKKLMIEGVREAAHALAPGAGQLLKAGVKAAAYRAGGYALSAAAAGSGLFLL